MHADAKKMVKAQKYTSVSELIRDAMRKIMYRNITVNGFTKQFEEETLQAEKDADLGNVVEWNGKGSFTDFVLSNPVQNDKNRVHRKISPRSDKNS